MRAGWDRVDVDPVHVAGGGVGTHGGDRERFVGALQCRPGSPRRLDDHDGMVRIDLFQVLVDGDASGGRNVGVGRLVGSFPGAEAGMALERVDDLVEQRLLREIVVDAGQREPELEPVRWSGVELLPDRDQLLVEPGLRPDGVVANEVGAGACDRCPGVLAVGCGSAERGWIRQPEREHGLAVD